MQVLVVGLRDVDSGKTTLAQALLRSLRGAGRGVRPFKPWSASDLWVHHDLVARDLERGRLGSRDAERLQAAAGTALPAPVVNPVHRLWTPLPAREHPRQRSAPAVDRVARLDGRVEAVVHPGVELPEEVEAWLAGVDGVHRVGGSRDLTVLQGEHHVPAVREAWAEVREGDGWVVVESYSDVATPPGLDLVPEVVLAAEPGRVHRFHGPRFVRALEVAVGSGGVGSEAAAWRVLDLVDPVASVEVPRLAGDARGSVDAVAEAYGPALAELVPEAVGEEL